MALNFDKFATEGNAYLNDLATQLKVSNKEKAGRMLKAVLHAVRNHLSPEESIQLIAQFPMFLKAAYVDGWTLSQGQERIKHLEDFIKEVRQQDGRAGLFDFETEEDVKLAIIGVFVSLRQYVSEGELEDIAAQLPKELKPLVEQRVVIEKSDKAKLI